MSSREQERMIKELNTLKEELGDMKKLLILHLIKSGVSTREIRSVLKISGKEFYKLFPSKR